MKNLIRLSFVLIGYVFVVACPMGPSGSPAGVDGGAKGFIGQPPAASGGDAEGAGATAGDSGSGVSTGGATTNEAAAPGTTSDTPISATGTPMGIIPMPSPQCPTPDDETYVFSNFQMGWAGRTDDQGRLEIETKQWFLKQGGAYDGKGFSNEMFDIYDEAFPDKPVGMTASSAGGCVSAKIYFPPNRVNRQIKFVFHPLINPACNVPRIEETITVPDPVPETVITPCDKPTTNPGDITVTRPMLPANIREFKNLAR